MTRAPQRLGDYLTHILEAIDRIGEASNNIQKQFPDFAAAHPELPLAFAYQMRNAVAHGYFAVDFEIVWKSIEGDLPSLRRDVAAAFAALSPDA